MLQSSTIRTDKTIPSTRQNSPRNESLNLKGLSENIWIHIFHYLSASDLTLASLVCQQWRGIINETPHLYRKKWKVSDFLFGQDAWRELGIDIKEEPPISQDLYKLANRVCRLRKLHMEYFPRSDEYTNGPDKLVKETHYLILIPSHIDNKRLSLMDLLNLFLKYRQNTNPAVDSDALMPQRTEYCKDSADLFSRIFSLQNSYWALIARNNFHAGGELQNVLKLPKHLSSASKIPYELVTGIEVVAMMVMRFVRKVNAESSPPTWCCLYEAIDTSHFQEDFGKLVAFPHLRVVFEPSTSQILIDPAPIKGPSYTLGRDWRVYGTADNDALIYHYNDMLTHKAGFVVRYGTFHLSRITPAKMSTFEPNFKQMNQL